MFDGEEQLYNNTMFGPDGLYGSKYMAELWANTSYLAEGQLARPAIAEFSMSLQLTIIVLTLVLEIKASQRKATEFY